MDIEEASLSLKELAPPPQPSIGREAGVPGTSPATGAGLSLGAEGSLPSPLFPMPSRDRVLVQKTPVQGSEGGVFQHRRPATVTLELLWDQLAIMEVTLKKQIGEVNFKLNDFTGMVTDLTRRQEEQEGKFEELKALVYSYQEAQTKDCDNLRKKLEHLENVSRKNNLRILNCPHSPLMSPLDLLKKYFKEILCLAEELMPPIIKVLYLEMGHKEGDQYTSVGDPLNLTEFLESSLELITSRATLLVTFAFESDQNNILKLYFCKISEQFMGSVIRIFPDVSRSTQSRRKEFLALRARILALGGIFKLHFPCRCLIMFGNNNFLFTDPKKLLAMIEEKEASKMAITES